MAVDPELLEILACPNCKTPVTLVKNGTDVNVKDRIGATPLMHAAAIGSIDAMRLLIDSGADVNAKNTINGTSLMWAGPCGSSIGGRAC